MIYPRIDRLRAAAGVDRFHTAQTLRTETVGHHSFNVANLLLMMTEGECSKRLIVAALLHDLGEVIVGDIPSPTKKKLPEEVQSKLEEMEEEAVKYIHPYAPDLTADEWRVLKLADNLDGLLKCRDELRLGNRNVRPIGDRYLSYIDILTEGWYDYEVFVRECKMLYIAEVEK